MMKNYKVLLLFLLFGLFLTTGLYGQDSVVVGSMRNKNPLVISGRTMPDIPSDSIYQLIVQINKNQLNPIFIINNVVIRDTLRIEKFREKYLPTVDKVEYLNKDQALDEYNIKHEDGILRIFTKKKKIIDI